VFVHDGGEALRARFPANGLEIVDALEAVEVQQENG